MKQLSPMRGGAEWSMQGDGQRYAAVGEVSGGSDGTTVTAGSPAHTKGAWAELEAASAFDASGIVVMITSNIAGAAHLHDIGIGASSSEKVILPNLMTAGGSGGMSVWYFPIFIPAGTRIVGRSQGQFASDTFRFTCELVQAGFLPSQPLSRVVAYGANTADSGGQAINAGPTIHTKGAWAELSAAINNDMRAIVLNISNQNNTIRGAEVFLMDIGVGAGGSEKVVIPDLALRSSLESDLVSPLVFPPFPCHIPAGERLSARCQSSLNDVADRQFDLIAFGLD